MSELYYMYHPIDGGMTATPAEREELLKTGMWFDSPDEAAQYRKQVEDQIKQEEQEREETILNNEREAAKAKDQPKRKRSRKAQEQQVEEAVQEIKPANDFDFAANFPEEAKAIEADELNKDINDEEAK